MNSFCGPLSKLPVTANPRWTVRVFPWAQLVPRGLHILLVHMILNLLTSPPVSIVHHFDTLDQSMRTWSKSLTSWNVCPITHSWAPSKFEFLYKTCVIVNLGSESQSRGFDNTMKLAFQFIYWVQLHNNGSAEGILPILVTSNKNSPPLVINRSHHATVMPMKCITAHQELVISPSVSIT